MEQEVSQIGFAQRLPSSTSPVTHKMLRFCMHMSVARALVLCVPVLARTGSGTHTTLSVQLPQGLGLYLLGARPGCEQEGPHQLMVSSAQTSASPLPVYKVAPCFPSAGGKWSHHL